MENHGYNRHSIPLFVPPPSSVFSVNATTTSNWAFLCRAKSDEEGEEQLRQALLYAALEIESTKAAAQDELSRMEVEAAHLKALLEATARERDEARKQCHHALLLLHAGQVQNSRQHGKPEFPQFLAPPPPDENGAKAAASASSEESSIVSSPPQPQQACVPKEAELELPEKGKLLEAVMRAGPLLQNLLLAGPLPQWRHPPPPLHSFEIPPVPIAVTDTAAAATEIKKEGGGKKRKVRDGDPMMGAAAQSSSPSSSSWPLSPTSNGNATYQRSATRVEGMEEYY